LKNDWGLTNEPKFSTGKLALWFHISRKSVMPQGNARHFPFEGE
jgi:hypothetical protein